MSAPAILEAVKLSAALELLQAIYRVLAVATLSDSDEIIGAKRQLSSR